MTTKADDDVSIPSESRENLVEVYTKRRFFQKRTRMEKHLVVAVVVLLVLFLVFFILYLVFQQYYHRLVDEAMCTSSECIESAMMLLRSVNLSQNPCDDFYNFACGNFGREHPLEGGYAMSSWFAEKEERLNRLIQKVLEAPTKPSDPASVKGTKHFYRSCMNGSELNQLGLEPLFELLELVRLPRSVPAGEESEGFNLAKTLALAQRHLSQDILVTVSISRGEIKNDTMRNATLLRLSPGLSGSNMFKKNLRRDDRDDEQDHSLKRLSPQKVILATISFIADVLREIQSEAGESNGLNSTELVATAYKIITFTSQLVKDWKSMNNASFDSEDEFMTFAALQSIMDEESASQAPSNKIDWKDYLSTLFEEVNSTFDFENEMVAVENVDYFKYLSRMLGEAKPLSIQRHIWWRLVEEFGRYTTSNMRNAYLKYSQTLYGESTVSSRAQTCTSVMKRFMNVALSHQMANFNNFSGAAVKVRQMLRDIVNVFESMVNAVTWMDPATKFSTLDKAKSIKDEIGYPPWLLDPSRVDAYYKGLELKRSEFLGNVMRVNHWEVEKVLATIGPDRGEQANGTVTWFSNPLQVNAYYSRLDNSISIPPGILQTPFYFRGLESLNYGAIGSILGHELTHGFDIDGKNFNKFGERSDSLWPEAVTSEFESRAKCFVHQYEKYKVNRNKRLNGTVTLAENIADNGGMRESFKAYKLYSSRHGKEPKLPGFERFTHDQLVFLSFANIWCEDSFPRYSSGEDSHSPHRVRVLATLQNMKEFSEAFNCPPESFMNPRRKCIIW